MEYSPCDIPVVMAIKTAPLVTMSAQVIDGVGLDRETGLVWVLGVSQVENGAIYDRANLHRQFDYATR